MKCPICKSSHSVPSFNLWDDRYGYPGKFKLRRCRICGHVFLESSFSPDQLARLYTDYYPRSALDADEYCPHIEKKKRDCWLNGEYASAFRWVPKDVRILDIGCGFGESLGYHASRGCDVYGVEADENIRRVAEKQGFRVHVGVFDPTIYEPNFFDYITMDQVMEHMTDPIETLRRAARILKPKGQIIITVPNSQGWGARIFSQRWINWHTPYHQHFFSKESMGMTARKAGLEILKVKSITNSHWLSFQWHHLLFYPKYTVASDFWSPNCGPVPKKRYWRALLALTHITKINHMITRLFDALGYGDNHLFILEKP
ncbi:class I SAM-dependent methyltransferase [Desulfoluna butyratoxydans]|uniref:S-adenosyl-l-methionine-dependent methyltransferase n=1 Tax=Desulfoluna butyratoxydans TaxID=231438 RepID=A0A4V6IM16_9BACT|nr:class I SAM-dependent methyltransferase [Desulfoluna butyratoxydans]VFQ47298.1 s-adenosyl-l-methionine-dependent methyltransferase [Desulfoluna butyratoxydans]